MPPTSRSIDEEGVLLDGVQIVAGGELLETEVRTALARGRFPARNPDQNVADLKAQLAANARGVVELERVIARFGVRTVERYMRHVQHNAAACVRAAIARLHDGRFTVELDGGERICVAVSVDATRRRASVDFTGTSPASAGNFNAPTSIVRAAVLYVFRTLVRENIPLNAGCLEPLTIVLPPGSLLDPHFPAAVVAGNVETSQCITDALLAALDACAGSQGTMNNFTFGNARHQYYETLCGGAGAGPGFAGASAVHTHMTNSRLTDPEVLEQRYPVRIRRVHDPPRLRRRGPLARRRRRRPRDRISRADACRDSVEPAACGAGGARRRLARRMRPQLRAAGGRGHRGVGGDGRGRARGRRSFRHRDAGRRGLRARLAQVPLGFAHGQNLGGQARSVVPKIVDQELVRRARRKPDAQRDCDVAGRLACRARTHVKRLVGRRARQRTALLESR